MKLSVIIPAHNEGRNVLNALQKLTSFLNSKRKDYEIIVSEDGSTDDTLHIAEAFAKGNKRVKILHSGKRLGKGGGVLKGFKEAKGDIVAFIDADLSSGPSELEKVVNAVMDGNDLAVASRNMKGSRVIRNRPFLRRIAAKGMNLIVNSMFGLSISDTQCGLKAISRQALEKILPLMTRTGFEFDVELLMRVKNAGMKIKEVPIVWSHQQKTSKISGLPVSVSKQIGGGILDLWIRNSFDRYDMCFFLFLALFIAVAVPFLGNYIDPDEGTHLAIAAFYYNMFRDVVQHSALSFSKVYNYAIAYLVHYPKLSLYYPPGFHSTIALLSYIFGLSSVTGAAVGLIFGTITILAVYYFGRKFFDRKTGVVAAIIFAIVPQVFYLSVKAMLDLTYIFFFLISLTFYLFALKSGRTRHFIYAGIVMAIGFLFKQNIVLLTPIIFLYALAVDRKSLKKIVASFAVAAIITLPYLLLVYKLGLISVMFQSSLGIGSSAQETRPQFTSLAGWLFYSQKLGEIYFSYPVLVASFLALAYYCWKKERYWKLLLLWFFTIFLFFVVVPNKEGRYMLPAIPALILPLAFYITKLSRTFSAAALAATIVLILYNSYLVLSPSFIYNTDYAAIASDVLQKKGNVLIAADSNSFYTSSFIFEMMRLDSSKQASVLRPCILGVKDIRSLTDENGIRYAIVPAIPLIPTSNVSAVTGNNDFQIVKTLSIENDTINIYENNGYMPQKENCNYVCVTGGWVCSNFTNPTDALK